MRVEERVGGEPTKYEMQKQERKQKIVRSEFKTAGRYEMPIIKKQDFDMDTIALVDYRKVKMNDKENDYKTVQFFCHDWHFENVFDEPEKATECLKQYYAVLTPDFSVYTDMPVALQIWSTFKNRWCGAYWQSLGFKVIPTIEWGDERSFEFCFDGIEQGAVVAVATYYRSDEEGFLKGYNKMMDVIKPSKVICYGKAFAGMKGNIYERVETYH